MAKKEPKADKIVLEREYNVPLRKEFINTPRYKRTNKAVRALKIFLVRHMKSEDIKISSALNTRLWERGIKNPPHHIKILARKDEKGIVRAVLPDEKKEEPKADEKKAKPAENKEQEKAGKESTAGNKEKTSTAAENKQDSKDKTKIKASSEKEPAKITETQKTEEKISAEITQKEKKADKKQEGRDNLDDIVSVDKTADKPEVKDSKKDKVADSGSSTAKNKVNTKK